MADAGKIIGGLLGFYLGGIRGAAVGAGIGSIFDTEGNNTNNISHTNNHINYSNKVINCPACGRTWNAPPNKGVWKCTSCNKTFYYDETDVYKMVSINCLYCKTSINIYDGYSGLCNCHNCKKNFFINDDGFSTDYETGVVTAFFLKFSSSNFGFYDNQKIILLNVIFNELGFNDEQFIQIKNIGEKITNSSSFEDITNELIATYSNDRHILLNYLSIIVRLAILDGKIDTDEKNRFQYLINQFNLNKSELEDLAVIITISEITIPILAKFSKDINSKKSQEIIINNYFKNLPIFNDDSIISFNEIYNKHFSSVDNAIFFINQLNALEDLTSNHYPTLITVEILLRDFLLDKEHSKQKEKNLLKLIKMCNVNVASITKDYLKTIAEIIIIPIILHFSFTVSLIDEAENQIFKNYNDLFHSNDLPSIISMIKKAFNKNQSAYLLDELTIIQKNFSALFNDNSLSIQIISELYFLINYFAEPSAQNISILKEFARKIDINEKDFLDYVILPVLTRNSCIPLIIKALIEIGIKDNVEKYIFEHYKIIFNDYNTIKDIYVNAVSSTSNFSINDFTDRLFKICCFENNIEIKTTMVEVLIDIISQKSKNDTQSEKVINKIVNFLKIDSNLYNTIITKYNPKINIPQKSSKFPESLYSKNIRLKAFPESFYNGKKLSEIKMHYSDYLIK
ncbi:hypothetical protein KAZ01_01970 [Candidatus Gracilibacteria bacterium]|mgnify:CR=1 FL=1|nr:hypothetical protein [Candidatus Gracilibacteria bacterium]